MATQTVTELALHRYLSGLFLQQGKGELVRSSCWRVGPYYTTQINPEGYTFYQVYTIEDAIRAVGLPPEAFRIIRTRAITRMLMGSYSWPQQRGPHYCPA
jgi:hypothetical protein